MKVQENQKYTWYEESENPQGGYFEGIDIEMKGEDILYICHSGANDYEVEEVMQKPYIKRQLQKIRNNRLKGVVYYYGGEDLLENYKTRHDLKMFLVWSVAWAIYEDEMEREEREGVAA